jgi:hypothetical protein
MYIFRLNDIIKSFIPVGLVLIIIYNKYPIEATAYKNNPIDKMAKTIVAQFFRDNRPIPPTKLTIEMIAKRITYIKAGEKSAMLLKFHNRNK